MRIGPESDKHVKRIDSCASVRQRAENGALDPSWLDFAIFSPEVQNTLGPLDRKSGRPKSAKSNP